MKGFRTVLFNVGAAIMPVLQASGGDLGLDGNTATLYALGVAMINLILRTITTTPVGQAK